MGKGVMIKKTCHLEEEITRCLNADKLTPEFKKHLSDCPLCQEIASVQGWMKQLKNKSWNAEMSDKILPQPEAIWERATIKRRPDRKLVKKALKPLLFPQIFSYGVLILGFFILLFPNMKKIRNILDSSSSAGFAIDSLSKLASELLPYFLMPMFIVLISILFCVFVLAFEKRKKTA